MGFDEDLHSQWEAYVRECEEYQYEQRLLRQIDESGFLTEEYQQLTGGEDW